MRRLAYGIIVTLCGLCFVLGVAIAAEDVEGGQDHPLFGRYEGSTIEFYKSSEFDEVALLQAPHDFDSDPLKDRSGADWLKGEGRVTAIRYDLPTGRSSLEVMRNYEKALKAQGFQTVFKCADQACLVGKIQDPYYFGQLIDPTNGLPTRYFDHARYMLVRLDRPEGVVFGGVLVGEDKTSATAFLTILETQPMETDKIKFIDAGEMQQSIAEEGRISLYGIEFDFDKDLVRSESEPTVAEIAKLLNGQPDLKLEIVGHTDDQGTAEYNLDLSQRRAANVVAALTQEHGIAEDRLTWRGAGLTSPVAPNDAEEGRARNRRVELVAR